MTSVHRFGGPLYLFLPFTIPKTAVLNCPVFGRYGQQNKPKNRLHPSSRIARTLFHCNQIVLNVIIRFNGFDVFVARMTETARLRHSMKEATLAKKAMAEEEERKKAAKKKRREEQLRQQVTRKSIHNDMKHVLEKQNKETLKRFR